MSHDLLRPEVEARITAGTVEAPSRDNKRLSRRLRDAKLRQVAVVEDTNFCTPRGLDRALFLPCRSVVADNMAKPAHAMAKKFREVSMLRSVLTLGAVCLVSGAAYAETVQFTGAMTGAAEVPAKTTSGKGNATAMLDTVTKALTYSVEYTGLSGPATAAHFHGPADPTANAGVVVPFASPASPIKGTATLTDAQMADLMAGKWYANVHTAANPGGEIRGQMTRDR